MRVGPLDIRVKRVTEKDDDPFFLDIGQLEDGYVYLMPRREPFKAALRTLINEKGLSLEATIRILLEEGLARWPLPEKPPVVPQAPDIFQSGGKTPVPNNPYSHFVVEAIAKGGPLWRFITDGWRENRANGQPQLLKAGFPGVAVPCVPTSTWSNSRWRTQAGIVYTGGRADPLTADVALAVLGTLGDPRQGEKPKYPLLEPVVITSGPDTAL